MAHADLSPSLSRADLAVLQPPAPQTLEHLDQKVRMTFVGISLPADSGLAASEILTRSVRFLEQRRAIAGIAEAFHRLDIRTSAEFESRSSEAILLARHLTRIDPIEILARDDGFVLAARNAGQALQTRLPDDFLRGIVRGMQSLLAICPIEQLVVIGTQLGRTDEGHRCRLSYDWLDRFIRRHSSGIDPTRDIVGQAYADGRLEVHEASSLLMMHISDAVAWLEDHGFARDIALTQLDEDERSAVLAEMRRDRMAGTRPVREEIIDRDVIASQRIEDVDARPWISPL